MSQQVTPNADRTTRYVWNTHTLTTAALPTLVTTVAMQGGRHKVAYLANTRTTLEVGHKTVNQNGNWRIIDPVTGATADVGHRAVAYGDL